MIEVFAVHDGQFAFAVYHGKTFPEADFLLRVPFVPFASRGTFLHYFET
ncbi:MAG: hypothetical protein RL040_508 [Bacteroidota bacterium]